MVVRVPKPEPGVIPEICQRTGPMVRKCPWKYVGERLFSSMSRLLGGRYMRRRQGSGDPETGMHVRNVFTTETVDGL